VYKYIYTRGYKMFIYKITCNDKVYYGLDSSPKYKQRRWKAHKRTAPTGQSKLSRAMREAGIDNCKYEVVEEGFSSLAELAAAEIQYIADGDTFKNGLNGTPGGDGIGYHDLQTLSESEIQEIKQSLSDNLSRYNTLVKWAGTTDEERKEQCAHLHTNEVYKRKSATLKETYKARPELAEHRSEAIKNHWASLPDSEIERRRKLNAENSKLGAQKTSKKVKVQFESGEVKIYRSKSEYVREFGHDINYVLMKTKEGKTHNGKRAWQL
jgi:hypothetical protein